MPVGLARLADLSVSERDSPNPEPPGTSSDGTGSEPSRECCCASTRLLCFVSSSSSSSICAFSVFPSFGPSTILSPITGVLTGDALFVSTQAGLEPNLD